MLVFFGLIICLTSFSQEKTDTANIYYKGLKLHIAYLQSNLKKDTLSISNNINVEYNEQTTVNLPSQIDNFKISYLNREEIKKLSAKKAIQLVVIKPVVINRNALIVNIIDFNVKFKQGNFNYVNCGGSKIEFVYDCAKDCFKVGNIRQGGI